jgi:3-ketoacyl-CoA synthase
VRVLAAGGYGVLKGIQDGMHLPTPKMIPSFAALREYGNTSCSTTWYVLSYIESCDKVKRGDKIMQIGEWMATQPPPLCAT